MHEVVIGKQRVALAGSIGKGGEGEVFSLKARSGHAIKIYSAKLRSQREAKVRAMVGEGLAIKTELIAYPGEIVTDQQGKFLGFVMRLVSGYRPLHELYSPKSRQRHFPNADYRFLVHAALNVARAVGVVHQTGCVIGDLNHSGIMISQNATAALIDADSFQFRLNGKLFPCVVGVPDFTPPELHGKNLASAERTIEHDNFGLAVAIFHLLFMGRHPYAGRYNGPDISMGDAIAQNRFAFSLTRRASTRTQPPPGALALDMFPEAVVEAFENAFGLRPGARPNAMEWIWALTKLQTSLSRCSRVKTHYYPSNAKGCVWCGLSANNGFDMFPDLSDFTVGASTNPRVTEHTIREILAFRFPTVTGLLPSPVVPKRPSSSLQEAKSGKVGRTLLGLAMIGGAAAGFIVAPQAWIIFAGLAFWGVTFFADRRVDAEPFKQAYGNADRAVQRELDNFVRRNGLAEVVKVHGDLAAAIEAYQRRDEELNSALRKLKSSRETRQRQAFLDRYPIRSAKVSGIGPAKTATLISFGIETAADVNPSAVLRVPGFGEVTTGKLVAWRRRHEARFKYDPNPNAQDIADEKALRGRFAAEKAKLESTISNGLGTLRNARARLDALPDKARSDRALMGALEARAQVEGDLKALGASVPASSVVLRAAPEPQSKPQQPAATHFMPTTARPRSNAGGTPNCPRCGSQMRKRSGRYGAFWGCSRYPSCRGTKRI